MEDGALDHERRGERATIEHPRIILAKGLLEPIYHYIAGFQELRGRDVETGGMLTGQFAHEANGPVFTINGFIGAGPNADCSEESVLFDTEYQSRALEAMREREPRIGNMGCIHVHPDCLDACSEGDWLADVEAVRASDTRSLVFAIVTVNNPRPGPLSLFHRNFKFDFFVLGEDLGYEYRHVRPVLVDAPALRAPTGDSTGGNGANGESLKGSSVEALKVSTLRRFNASTLQPSSAASCRMSDSPEHRNSRWVHYGPHEAWRPRLLKDKKRLVAEVRAMEERYGGRATLHLEGNLLYWKYTVVESGRRFPIQVRYPRRYPFEPPQIFSVLPLPGSPHQMPGNELCWTNRLGSSEWNPARDTAATCIHAAHRWFACLLVYLTLHKWPSEADDELR